MGSLLSSPRRRRRLAWLGGLLAVAGAVALAVVLIPSHGGGNGSSAVAPPVPSFRTTTSGPSFAQPSAAERRAQAKAEAAVRPLATAFVNDLIHRRELARAHALLTPSLRSRYTLADWEQGRSLPLSVSSRAAADGEDVAFSGASTVGLVFTITPNGGSNTDSILYAVRFVHTGKWLVDYVHQGQTSTYVDAANYAPHGFLPGSSSGGTSSWLILVLAFVGVVAVVVVLDRLLSDRGREP